MTPLLANGNTWAQQLGTRKVAVVIGGRHHLYETARAYDEVGKLQQFYTRRFVRRGAALAKVAGLLPGPVRRPLARALGYSAPHLDGRVTLFGGHGFSQRVQSWMGTRRLSGARTDDWSSRIADELVSQNLALHSATTNAGHLYTKLRHAGIPTVLEQYAGHPRTAVRLLKEEAQRWGVPPTTTHVHTEIDEETLIGINELEIKEADLIAAGSEFVRDTLILEGVDPRRIYIAHYGCNVTPRTTQPLPVRRPDEPLKIAFLGADWLRKGVLHLLEGVGLLNSNQVQVHIFGCTPPAHLVERHSKYCILHGHVPHAILMEQLPSYHVMSLPSLFEGSAYAVYEAMANGLPVIVTPNTGAVARDGVDGFVVPIRDPQAIARAVESCLDESRRQAMGRSALARVSEFTWETYRAAMRQALGF
jgi:glycosyltransferase involved in cell wall biosynthesis